MRDEYDNPIVTRLKDNESLMADLMNHICDHEPEDQYDAFTYLVLDLATALGEAWGFGHLGNNPKAWTAWALRGEEDWPDIPEDAGGVPSLWRDLKIKFDMEYPD